MSWATSVSIAQRSAKIFHTNVKLDHCLEAIRLSLMCAGNTALYSFQWPDSNEEVRKPKTKTNSERTCVDWNLIDQWARNRSIGMSPTLERPDVEPDHAHMHHDG
jgi:hypothetical protein